MSTSKEIFLKDYKAPEFFIDKTDLTFDIEAERTIVESKLYMRRNGEHENELVLDGVDLKLLELKIDGRLLNEQEYSVGPKTLSIKTSKDEFVLQRKIYQI